MNLDKHSECIERGAHKLRDTGQDIEINGKTIRVWVCDHCDMESSNGVPLSDRLTINGGGSR